MTQGGDLDETLTFLGSHLLGQWLVFIVHLPLFHFSSKGRLFDCYLDLHLCSSILNTF